MLQERISTDSQVEAGPPMLEHTSESKADDECADGNNNPSFLLITANVGSLFEDPHRLLQPWLKEFLQKVEQLQPQFLALHLQEVGGKTYEKSMEYVQEFIQVLCEASEMQDFSFIRIYMDEDFNSAEHFTALGNLYFGHKNLENLRIWNFLTHGWEQALGKNIYSGNIETISTKEKSKFPQHFFPECKWSRKGFMRTRWEINGTVIDLVNIHLFHDASNLAACEEFPSVYCKTRRRALVHTLERFHLDDKNGLAPYFVFGDFNFRCDTEGVIKELTQNLSAHRVQSIKSDSTKVHYRNSVGDNVLTVGKKEFNHADHQLKFKESWLKKYDRELEVLSEILVEFAINFPPSYPYEEDPDMPADYMSTRCPSWCDRILMSPQARKIIMTDGTSNPYNVIGESVCMGDHKPIYLHVRIKSNQGTYRCCNCYLHANNNKSTSHHIPAVTIACTTNTLSFYCPHRSRAYNEILFDCERLNSRNICPPVNRASNDLIVAPCLEDSTFVAKSSAFQLLQSSQIADETCNAGLAKCPPVSINVINSENMHVCWCAQITNADINVGGEGSVNNSSICPECRNIIKRQPSEHRYRLVSKRLLLANNIIVNRIDTQYLNAFFDVTKHRQDPYTPESVESHSPCPELNSTTTTTSSNSRSPYERDTVAVPSVMVGVKAHSGTAETCGSIDSAALDHKQQQQQRGVVTPGQLKSRLEDLKRYSLMNSGAENGTAGDSDVEDVEDICQTSIEHKRHTSSCLPGCCHWKQIDQVQEHLHQITNEILGDQADVWKEQSLVDSRTRYIQISQICRNEQQQSADIQDMDGLAGQGCVTSECNKLSSASPDQHAEAVAILKETTV